MSDFWKKVITMILAALGTLLGGTAVYNDLQAPEPAEYSNEEALQPEYTWGYEYLAVLELSATAGGGATPSHTYGRQHVFVFSTQSANPGERLVLKASKETLSKVPGSPQVKSYQLYLIGRKAVKKKPEEAAEE